MSFYIKKTKKDKGLYLQIYNTHMEIGKKYPVSSCHKTLGYYEVLKEKLGEDPIEFYQKEVDELNAKNKINRILNKVRKIEENDTYNFGYFLIQNIVKDLKVENDLENFNLIEKIPFSFSKLLTDLIYARVIKPCSKVKTFEEVFPELLKIEYKLHLKNLYKGLQVFGQYYEKVIEVFNYRISKKWKRKTDKTYFDGTNFYFEINKEDDFRKKGPSKENQRSPLVSVGLLLDQELIPLGMNIFSGNNSEKPVLRNIVNELKHKNNIKGKTIRIADKGLNCAENIIDAIRNKDGYIFSKSVKTTSELDMKEFDKVNFNSVNDKKTGENLFSYKSIIFEKEYQFKYSEGKIEKLKVKEKRILTFSEKLYKKQVYEFNKMVEDLINIKGYDVKRKEYGKKSKYIIVNDSNEVNLDIDYEKIQKDREKLGYNILITSEIDMSVEEIYTTYHELWHIEETFKMMKSSIDARPIFLQKKESIQGHFLIIYLSVLLIRLLEIKVFEKEIFYTKLIDTIRNLRVRKLAEENKYFNISKNTETLKLINKKLNLNIDNLYFENREINKLFKKSTNN